MLSVRFGRLVVLGVLLLVPKVYAQSEARERQAAAEAYDQGTAAYVAQDYEKAAQWFETANRLSPAAPALIQAARAHQQAGHLARAATLALALVQTYPDDASATSIGEGLLNDLGPKFVRVDVDCTDCALDVDGTLQEAHSFFVEPDGEHTVTASFETGERVAQVSGAAGETKSLSFEAPPPKAPAGDDGSTTISPPIDELKTKPLSPVVTYVGIGLTAALLVGSVASTLDTYSGVDAYEDAAKEWRMQCPPPADSMTCDTLKAKAQSKLDDGEGKETRTTVLWVVTSAVGVTTAVLALALTDWSGEPDAEQNAGRRLSLAVGATEKSAAVTLKGSF